MQKMHIAIAKTSSIMRAVAFFATIGFFRENQFVQILHQLAILRLFVAESNPKDKDRMVGLTLLTIKKQPHISS